MIVVRLGGVLLIVALGCAGSGTSASEPAPAEAPEVSVPEKLDKPDKPDQAVARAWGATAYGVAPDQLKVLGVSDAAGDPVFLVKPVDWPKQKPPKFVLVRGAETFSGRSGFEAWAATADRADPARLATACTFLVLGSRSEPLGVEPDDLLDYPRAAAPAFDAAGAVVFWYLEPDKSAAKRATLAVGPDGKIVSLDTAS